MRWNVGVNTLLVDYTSYNREIFSGLSIIFVGVTHNQNPYQGLLGERKCIFLSHSLYKFIYLYMFVNFIFKIFLMEVLTKPKRTWKAFLVYLSAECGFYFLLLRDMVPNHLNLFDPQYFYFLLCNWIGNTVTLVNVWCLNSENDFVIICDYLT